MRLTPHERIREAASMGELSEAQLRRIIANCIRQADMTFNYGDAGWEDDLRLALDLGVALREAHCKHAAILEAIATRLDRPGTTESGAA